MIDFNDAEPQIEFGLIPANTVAKARFVLKPGHYFSDPILTGSKSGDSVYLDCEFVILEGPYAKRKVFDKIGISGSDTWVNAGKSKIRAILESGKNVSPKDTSPAAAFARSIKSYEELAGLDVVIKIGIESDRSGAYPDKNRILSIITPDNPIYKQYMSPDIPWNA